MPVHPSSAQPAAMINGQKPAPCLKTPYAQPVAHLLNTLEPLIRATACADDEAFLNQLTPEVNAAISALLTEAQKAELRTAAIQALARLDNHATPNHI